MTTGMFDEADTNRSGTIDFAGSEEVQGQREVSKIDSWRTKRTKVLSCEADGT